VEMANLGKPGRTDGKPAHVCVRNITQTP